MNSPANPFEDFFKNPIYLEFKNHIFNYRLRRRAVQKRMAQIQTGRILEIGSGVSIMSNGGEHVIFSDITTQAMDFLKAKGIAQKALAMSMTESSFKTNSVDTILCSEVLEHIPDDHKAIQEMFRILAPGGSAILTVPIHSRFYTFDDAFVHHCRRYDVAPFLKLLSDTGFVEIETEKVTGLLDKAAFLIIAWIYATFVMPGTQKEKPKKDSKLRDSFFRVLLPIFKAANWLYAGLVHLETRIMPLGTTMVLLVHCRKPAQS